MTAAARALATSSPRAASGLRRLLVERASYWVLEGLRVLAVWLPERWLRTAAIGLGDLACFVIRWRRRVALDHVARAWPRLSQTQQHHCVRDAYAHLAFALLWTLRLPHLVARDGDATNVITRLVDIDAPTRAQLAHLVSTHGSDPDYATEAARTAIVTTGHVGVWELLPAVLGSPLLLPRHSQWIVYRPLHNASVNALVERLRAGTDRHLIADKNCFHVLVDALSSDAPQPSIVGLVADQRSTNPHARCAVRFLGQETLFSTGAARLHLATRSPLWFAALIVNPNHLDGAAAAKPFKLLLRPISTNKHDEKTVQELTQAYAEALQDTVEAYASQYLWIHNLWSTLARRLVSEESASKHPKNYS